MKKWQDQGIVLSARGHGENGAIVALLTEHHGRHAGYVRGAKSSKMRGTLEAGNLVECEWSARVEDSLGSYSLELSRAGASAYMDEPAKLAIIQSACALCDSALPEREGHAGLYHGFQALLSALETDIWAESYIMWEISFLRELGFHLELSKCAGTGQGDALAYVSPKTGRAVSEQAGAPYADKLLILPQFLGGELSKNPVEEGLTLTGYFLEHWVYSQHTKGVPQSRLNLPLRL